MQKSFLQVFALVNRIMEETVSVSGGSNPEAAGPWPYKPPQWVSSTLCRASDTPEAMVMARPATKQLGLTGILREVLAAPLRNPEITAAVFLLLLPCNFLITFPQVSPRLDFGDIGSPLNRLLRRLRERSAGKAAGHGGPPPAEVPAFQEFPVSIAPLDYVVGELTTMAMVYLAAVACTGKHASIRVLLSKVGRSWNQLIISSVHLQLFLAFADLFLVLAAVPVLFAPPSWVFLLVLLAFIFPTACFLYVFSVYLHIVCRLSLVVSAVEEDKYGVAAMAKAFALARRRKLLGIVLMALCLALNWFTPRSYTVMGGKNRTEIGAGLVVVGRFVDVLVDNGGRLLGWLLWTVYYHECNKSHGLVGKEDMGDEGRSLLPMPPSVHVDESMF